MQHIKCDVMKEKYLPIGTVVLLKDATKYLMITGYCSSTPDDLNTVYDYVAYLFPEGSLAGENVALFNHDQIATVAHMGLVNEEFNQLNNLIKESLEQELAKETTEKEVPSSVENMPSFTPDNINLMLSEIHRRGDDLKPVAEPTPFDDTTIKKLTTDLLSANNSSNDSQKNEDEKEETTVKKEVVADGQPVLQLQPIFEDASSQGSDSTSSDSGNFSGLARL